MTWSVVLSCYFWVLEYVVINDCSAVVPIDRVCMCVACAVAECAGSQVPHQGTVHGGRGADLCQLPQLQRPGQQLYSDCSQADGSLSRVHQWGNFGTIFREGFPPLPPPQWSKEAGFQVEQLATWCVEIRPLPCSWVIELMVSIFFFLVMLCIFVAEHFFNHRSEHMCTKGVWRTP